MRSRFLLSLLLACSAGAAHAFTLDAQSENPLISESSLRVAVNTVATAVGQNVPDDPAVKVYVFSRSIPSKTEAGRYTYFHRVELRRQFSAGPPYPYAGWLPIKSVERYGVATPEGSRLELDAALRDFFGSLKQVDPATGFQ